VWKTPYAASPNPAGYVPMKAKLVAPGSTRTYTGVVTKKISISLPDHVEAGARSAAQAEGLTLSAWLARAAERALTEHEILVAGRAAILEEIAENGPFEVTPEEERWVEDALAAAGLAERPRWNAD
jgi:hypothetical protein